ncbi:hypothetical protein ARGLB_037_01140 [Arthrobacter globiformis NBRC 12137]|uniref:Uncharacterized protein n=1 Tax=Arthrobacter globiformis (strain ATCC 8010 / DSM 20124 / JCM 1332 / NBRC 12137 / NCIMB 8907 / NRRL B-2979 / 168) TaxID=1077972 RepID=H0QK23_ARTG1|nr:hypothetical protein [Arthrobacter globiformis]GAB13263.1 hypothetical protein ARGLB_037_01140 [Arthrobacter globiformis NBRC 12137]
MLNRAFHNPDDNQPAQKHPDRPVMILTIMAWLAGVSSPTDEAFEQAFPASARETLVCVP